MRKRYWKAGPTNRIPRVLMVPAIGLLGFLGIFGAVAASQAGQQNPQSSWEQIPAGQPANLTATRPVGPKAAQDPPMVAAAPATTLTLKVDAPPLGGTVGSDGEIHDSFSPAFFAVPAGKQVHVTVDNYDSMWHTFTSTGLGVNVWIPPGADNHPSKVTFTFTAPSTGNYYWLCAIPCDPYSMTTPGYMEGEVHAVKA